MNSYPFLFGTSIGCYTPCSKLTDSIFKMETILFYILDGNIEQTPNQDFIHGILDLTGKIVTNQSKLTIFY